MADPACCIQQLCSKPTLSGPICTQFLSGEDKTNNINMCTCSTIDLNLYLQGESYPYGIYFGSCACCTNGGNYYFQCQQTYQAAIIATNTTVKVTQNAWLAAIGIDTNTSLENENESENINILNDDPLSVSINALAQLAASTAGQLAGDDIMDERQIKSAVTMACTFIFTYINKLADYWKSGKNLYIISVTSKELYGNTSEINKNDTNNSKYIVKTASSILEKDIPLTGDPRQWIFLTGNVDISIQTNTKTLLGATSKAQTTSSISMLDYTKNKTDNYTISSDPDVSLEIGLMGRIAQRPHISDVIYMSSEDAYPKTTNTARTESISTAQASTGLIICIFR